MTIVDNLRTLKIKAGLLADGQNYFLDIDVQVHDGVALLTGNVETADQKAMAADLAYKVGGVYEVANEINVIPHSLCKTVICSLENDVLICKPAGNADGDETESRLRNKLLAPECQTFAGIRVSTGLWNLIKLDGRVPKEEDLQQLYALVLGTDGVFGIDSSVSVMSA
jgi:hypothetical protein